MEEVTREETEAKRLRTTGIDTFGDDRFVVGGDLAAGFAEEERRGAGVVAGGGAGVDPGADFGEFSVDGFGGDRATRDVDDVKARALAEKTDGRWDRDVARGLKCGVILER